MHTELEGYYLDGRTAARRRVRVRLTRMGLQIEPEQGAAFFWPYEEIDWSGADRRDAQMRVEHKGEIPEVLLVPGSSFVKAVRFVAPEHTRLFRSAGIHRSRILQIAGSVIGAGVVLFALYAWGIPALASLISPYIPISWEESLGQGVVDYFAPPAKQCGEPGRKHEIDTITQRLSQALPQHRYTFRVIVVNDSMVNALAAPGGYILIFRGLLEQCRTPEEFAAVLAHEMQHVLGGHVTRQILQQASMRVLIAAMTGDASDAVSYGLGAASTLGMLRYSRQYEEEADKGAVRLLAAAKSDPMGLARFFELMKHQDRSGIGLPAYLSTHPALDERIARAKALAEEAGVVPTPLAEGKDWRDITDICKKK